MQTPSDLELSRRALLKGTAASVAVTALPSAANSQAAVENAQAAAAEVPSMSKVSFSVNGMVRELGICGVAAAIANAIYNATGVRVREYPITLNKLLNRLPDIG
jgi:hypothetical protein